MFVSKISLKGIHSNNGLLLDVVDIQTVAHDFACERLAQEAIWIFFSQVGDCRP